MFNEDFQLHPDEHVIMYVRRHWFFLLLDILQVAFYFLIPAVFIWFAQYFGMIPNFAIFGILFNSLLDILVYMWGILCWLLLAEKVTDYAIDFWIVTNKRIVDSNLEKLFHRYLATLELKDIEDISIKTSGFISSYLAYGDLEVQTAGARNRFEMEQIGHPEIVQRTIFEAKMVADQEEKDIEKQEVEQISHRVFKEENVKSDFHIPHDQKIENTVKNIVKKVEEKDSFDWARVSEEEQNMAEVEEKFKKGVDEALRTE